MICKNCGHSSLWHKDGLECYGEITNVGVEHNDFIDANSLVFTMSKDCRCGEFEP